MRPILRVLLAIGAGCGARGGERAVAPRVRCDVLTAPVEVPREAAERERWAAVGRARAELLGGLYRLFAERRCGELDAAIQDLLSAHADTEREILALQEASVWHFDRWADRHHPPGGDATPTVAALRTCAALGEATRQRVAALVMRPTCTTAAGRAPAAEPPASVEPPLYLKLGEEASLASLQCSLVEVLAPPRYAVCAIALGPQIARGRALELFVGGLAITGSSSCEAGMIGHYFATHRMVAQLAPGDGAAMWIVNIAPGEAAREGGEPPPGGRMAGGVRDLGSARAALRLATPTSVLMLDTNAVGPCSP